MLSRIAAGCAFVHTTPRSPTQGRLVRLRRRASPCSAFAIPMCAFMRAFLALISEPGRTGQSALGASSWCATVYTDTRDGAHPWSSAACTSTRHTMFPDTYYAGIRSSTGFSHSGVLALDASGVSTLTEASAAHGGRSCGVTVSTENAQDPKSASTGPLKGHAIVPPVIVPDVPCPVPRA